MAKYNKGDNLFILAAFVFGCLLVGSLGSVFTIPSIPGWYAGLNKPSFNPPNWIFGPVWSVLFILMGISAYLVYRQGIKKNEVREALFIFAVQFGLNVLWSFLFFGLRSPALGFAGIIPLWISIAGTIISFYKISKTGSYLLMPYILWVTFAAFLNATIYLIN
jgi:tryptophan-rich sensory protein